METKNDFWLEAVVQVRGMRDGRHEASARSALSLIDGVEAVRVSRETGIARVYFDPGKVQTAQFLIALGAVGLDGDMTQPPSMGRTPAR